MQADIANGWCVNQWHELLDIVDENAVEEVDVVGLEGGEVEVLVDRCRAGIYHLHGAGNLCGHGLHDMWNETGEVLDDALFRGEGAPYRTS